MHVRNERSGRTADKETADVRAWSRLGKGQKRASGDRRRTRDKRYLYEITMYEINWSIVQQHAHVSARSPVCLLCLKHIPQLDQHRQGHVISFNEDGLAHRSRCIRATSGINGDLDVRLLEVLQLLSKKVVSRMKVDVCKLLRSSVCCLALTRAFQVRLTTAMG